MAQSGPILRKAAFLKIFKNTLKSLNEILMIVLTYNSKWIEPFAKEGGFSIPEVFNLWAIYKEFMLGSNTMGNKKPNIHYY